MKRLLVFASFAGLNAYAQQLPQCLFENTPGFNAAIITDVSNLAQRAPAPPFIGTQPNIFANLSDKTILPATIAPGEVISLIGAHLAEDDLAHAVDQGWPITLNNTQVLVGGVPAPIFYAGRRRDNILAIADGEILFQMPYNLAGSSTTLQVVQLQPTGICGGNQITIPVSPMAGALVRFGGNVAVQGANGSLVSVVAPGEEIAIYAVGLGDVDPPAEAGKPALMATVRSSLPDVRISDKSAVVVYAGLSPGSVGLYQLNFVVPSMAAGTYTVTVGMDGQSEQFSIQVQ